MSPAEWREHWNSHDPYIDTKSKRCSLCREEKPGTDFYRCLVNHTGLQSQCIACVKKRPPGSPRYKDAYARYMEKWREGNSEYWRSHDPYEEVKSKVCTHCKLDKPSKSFQKSWAERDGLQAWCRECLHTRHIDDPARQMFTNAKSRAKRKGLEFTITKEDIIVPERCPVLGISINPGNGQRQPNSPTLDRKNNFGGYTPDNIRVISYRANTLKSDATVEEIEQVLRYMKEP